MAEEPSANVTPQDVQTLLDDLESRLAGEQPVVGEQLGALRRGLAALPLAPRRGLLRSLARLGERAIPVFEALARDQAADVAALGIEGLALVRSPHAASVLDDLAARAATRDLRKEARRALHRLHAAGVRPAEAAATAQPAAGPARRRPEGRLYRAHASGYDGRGTRSIRIAAELPGGGLDVIVLLAQEEDGIKDAAAGELSRRDFAEFAQKLPSAQPILWAEVPPAYAYWLAEEFRDLNRQARRPVPKGYELFRQAVGPPPIQYERPIVYDEISAIRVRLEPGLVEQCDRLLGEPAFEGWFVEDERLLRLAHDLLVTRRGLLTTAARSAQEQKEILVGRALREVVDRRHRRLYKRRLEETGYLYLRLGQPYLARLCVAAAVNLDPVGGIPPERHPFAVELMRRSLDIAADLVEKGMTYEDMERAIRSARRGSSEE